MTTSTDLSPVVQGAQKALSKGKTSLTDIIVAARGAVLAASRNTDVAWRPQPPVPVLALTQAERAAVADLLSIVSDVSLPTSVRKMEEREIKDVIRLKEAAAEAAKAVEKITLAAKVAFFNHSDEVAVEKGLVTPETPITKEGWYVVEDKASGALPGEGKKPVREVRSGTVTLAAEDLKALVGEGVLAHEDYLALTKQVRIVDEANLHAAIEKNPNLAEAINKAVKVGAPQASFTLRANS